MQPVANLIGGDGQSDEGKRKLCRLEHQQELVKNLIANNNLLKKQNIYPN